MEERRQDYPEIKERLAVLEALQNKDIKDADDWRKIFCNKMDKLSDVINKFPCGERKAWYEGMSRQVGFMWLVLGIVLVSLIGSYNASATQRDAIMTSLNSIEKTVEKTDYQVSINTKRLDKLEIK